MKKQTSKQKSNQLKYVMFCDGATYLSNPSNRTGIGVICYEHRGSKEVFRLSEATGPGTNNWAEYMSLIIGLDTAINRGIQDLCVYMDSRLVVEQVNGRWKVKHDSLVPLHRLVLSKMDQFENIKVSWVERDLNNVADELSKSGVKRYSKFS